MAIIPYHSHSPYHSHVWKKYGFLRNMYLSHRKDNREAVYGNIWVWCGAVSHIKTLWNPYMAHRCSHIRPIYGPCMSHITQFGKGFHNKFHEQTVFTSEDTWLICIVTWAWKLHCTLYPSLVWSLNSPLHTLHRIPMSRLYAKPGQESSGGYKVDPQSLQIWNGKGFIHVCTLLCAEEQQ